MLLCVVSSANSIRRISRGKHARILLLVCFLMPRRSFAEFIDNATALLSLNEQDIASLPNCFNRLSKLEELYLRENGLEKLREMGLLDSIEEGKNKTSKSSILDFQMPHEGFSRTCVETLMLLLRLSCETGTPCKSNKTNISYELKYLIKKENNYISGQYK